MNVRIQIILLLFISFIGSAIAQEYTSYLPENENIQYEGRINFSTPSMPTFAFPGISIKARFQGTGVKVNLRGWQGSDSNYFNVFIDGVFVKKITLGEETINEVCQIDLTDDIHTVEITKRTESFLGKAAFLGFDIQGVLLSPDPKPTRKIQFIGNSITCGYGNEDVTTSGFVADKENNYLAYGAVCARELEAQYQAIAYSGRGVTFNWNCTEADLVPVIYEKYFADEDLSTANQVDHSAYIPDVIAINLGTNDHSCDQLTDENFKTNYIQFITTLRSYYPDAKILCLTGPMNSTDIFKTRLEDIVVTSGGQEEGIYFFHQTPIIDINYAGGHWHPNTLMADINGLEVAAFIEENSLFPSSTSSSLDIIDIQNKIYPNPIQAGDPIQIDLSGITYADSIQLKMYNIDGKLVYTQKLRAGQINEISSKNMKGSYLIELQCEGRFYSGRLIVY